MLNDRAKFNKIKEEVIRLGLCANDTTIISASDTIILSDTLYYIDTEIINKNDTTYISSIKYRDIIKKIYIRDTIKSIIVDNARIKLLEADYNKMKLIADEWKEKAQSRLSWLILSLVAIGLWVFFKIKPWNLTKRGKI